MSWRSRPVVLASHAQAPSASASARCKETATISYDMSQVATCCMVKGCRMAFQMLVIQTSFNVDLMPNYLRNALHLLLCLSTALQYGQNNPISSIMSPAMCQLFGLSASLTCTKFQLSCGWERARKVNTSAVSTPCTVCTPLYALCAPVLYMQWVQCVLNVLCAPCCMYNTSMCRMYWTYLFVSYNVYNVYCLR